MTTAHIISSPIEVYFAIFSCAPNLFHLLVALAYNVIELLSLPTGVKLYGQGHLKILQTRNKPRKSASRVYKT